MQFSIIQKRAFEQGMKQGLEQGIAQGFEHGIEHGIEHGLERGRLEGKFGCRRETAKNLKLLDVDVEKIAMATGLPHELVESL